MSIQIRRLSYALGAEVSGIDIRKPLDDLTLRAVRNAFLEHGGVLVFRGREITREQHIAFSGQFGEVEKTAARGLAEYPELEIPNNNPAKKNKKSGYSGSDIWHTDGSYTLVPPMASLLRGMEIPPIGGDTMFANMTRAYEALSDGMKKLLEGLHGIHVGGGGVIDNSTPERLAETMKRNQAAQPLVRVHPETGKKNLYLSAKIRQLVGLTAEESAPLLKFLCEHATRPQFVYRHVWQKDDLVMWDDRCTMHIAVNDYDRTQKRHMERTLVRGTPSGYAYAGPVEAVIPGSDVKLKEPLQSVRVE